MSLFLKTRGEVRFCVGIPHRLFELNRLKWFWKNLGLNKNDLAKLHPDWIDEIYYTGLGVEQYENDRARTNNMERGAVVRRGNIQTKKLL